MQEEKGRGLEKRKADNTEIWIGEKKEEGKIWKGIETTAEEEECTERRKNLEDFNQGSSFALLRATNGKDIQINKLLLEKERKVCRNWKNSGSAKTKRCLWLYVCVSVVSWFLKQIPEQRDRDSRSPKQTECSLRKRDREGGCGGPSGVDFGPLIDDDHDSYLPYFFKKKKEKTTNKLFTACSPSLLSQDFRPLM